MLIKVKNCKIVELKQIVDENDGVLSIAEQLNEIPFEVKRMFYVFGVHNQNDRGKHSHYKTKQLLISVNGIIDGKSIHFISFKSLIIYP